MHTNFNHTHIKACSNGEIRLEDGPNNIETEGRVEVCINGRWGTVQTSNNVNAVAKAVCSNFSLKLESFTNCLGKKYYKLLTMYGTLIKLMLLQTHSVATISQSQCTAVM